MLTKTDAIVIKSMKYRDTSKIVTFYTREFGKLKGIAKGARAAKNKFGAALEPLTHVSLVVYKKENRDLHLISACDIIDPYKRIHSELEPMAAGLSVLELLNQLTHEEERNLNLFSLVRETLVTLERARKNSQTLSYAFQLRVVALMGFAPTLDACGECGSSIEPDGTKSIAFQIGRGALLCNKCASADRFPGEEHSLVVREPRKSSYHSISFPTAQILRRLASAPLQSLPTIEYDERTGNELGETLRLYLRYHFEELKPLKSDKIFHQMLA